MDIKNSNNQEILPAKQSTKNYKKILNNLLNISMSDSCLFSNINNNNSFDVAKKFGNDFFDKMIINKYFLLSLTEMDISSFITRIEAIEELTEVEEIYQSFNEDVPESIQKLISAKTITPAKIESAKKEIIKAAEVKKQKSSFNWKILLNKAQTINEQNNLWPLHLGFIYITLKIDNKSIQAPLFLKEVNIQIKNSNVSIVSIGDIKINEKLTYFLESNGFLFDLDFDFSKMSIKEVYDTIQKSWSQNFDMPSTLSGFAPNLKSDEINNSKIEFWPGVTLGFFEPTGGYLRKIMVKIIESGIVDEILEVEFDKNIYKDTIKATMFKKNFGFFKTQHSNLSQDKAVISALNQNTIIWGPPGTGKSQTISNIITNVLMYDKTAIVASQKKAALEVLKNRMEELGMFCLFILNDKDMNKKSFYTPIQSYINYLENFDNDLVQQPIKIISDYEKSFMKLINKIKSEPHGTKNMHLFSWYMAQNKFDIKIFEDIKNLPKTLIYDLPNLKESKNVVKFLMNKNNLKSTMLKRSTTEVKEAAKIIENNFLDKNLDLDNFVKKQSYIDLNIMESVNKLHQFNLNNYENKVNDPSELKEVIGKMIFQKIKKFNKNMKSKYNAFALDARTASLEPNQFIKKHSDIVKILFPIIITTPETELRSWTRNEFDYAILDESSQIFLEKGIPILYLAKIKILAGDDQQMQPTRWFAAKVEGENTFGDIESLLDFATAKGVYSILLDKNYRSNHASLMTFNSEKFYKGELDVVDVNSSEKITPIDVINVDGVWLESTNQIEIEVAIREVLNNLAKYKKIILLCFNGSQQTQIEKLIFTQYPEIEKAMASNQLLIRNIENIQGDEADLVIMTIVYDKHTKLHSSYVAKSGGKNALNVAISRAKDKMIIIKSIKADDINNPSGSEDIAIFKEWLKFLDFSDEKKKNYITRVAETTKPTSLELAKNKLLDSFIEGVQKGLDNAAGVEVIKNFSIGTMKIDVAIIDKNTQNFIQGFLVDNFSYFKSYEDYVVDRDLKNFLLIKKYPVIKVNEMNWVINKNQIIHNINLIINKKQFAQKSKPQQPMRPPLQNPNSFDAPQQNPTQIPQQNPRSFAPQIPQQNPQNNFDAPQIIPPVLQPQIPQSNPQNNFDAPQQNPRSLSPQLTTQANRPSLNVKRQSKPTIPPFGQEVPQNLSRPLPQDVTQPSRPPLKKTMPLKVTKPLPQDVTQPSRPPVTEEIKPNLSRPLPQDVTQPSRPPVTEEIKPNLSRPLPQDATQPSRPPVTEEIKLDLSRPLPQDVTQPSRPPVTEEIKPNLSRPLPQDVTQPSRPPVTEEIKPNLSSPLPQDVTQPSRPPVSDSTIVLSVDDLSSDGK